MPTVKVKARRHYSEGAKAAWQSEKRGMYWADIYYDCDEETDDILDKGKDIPGFDEWPNSQLGYGVLCVSDSLPGRV